MDLSGQKFGRLTVLSKAKNNKRDEPMWYCECECGVTKEIPEHSLRGGNSRSCGCLRRKLVIERTLTHGESKSAEHRTWTDMRSRCNNPKAPNYKYYGARGIKVCDRWQKFENFLSDMGRRPGPEYSIDRIDNNGDYEPGNCRWATRSEQRNNTRSIRPVEFNGEIYSLADLSRLSGITKGALKSRLNNGLSGEEALRFSRPTRVTDDDIREIQSRLSRGDTQVEIANDFGISQNLVNKIKLGRRKPKG